MLLDTRFYYLIQLRAVLGNTVSPITSLAFLPDTVSNFFTNMYYTRDSLERELARVNQELEKQRLSMLRLAHLQAENERLNELLRASAIVEDPMMRSQIIGINPDPYNKRILVNRGANDNVFIGQPVLDASGIMGQVVEVLDDTSWVLLVSDPLHATPVVVNRNGIRAIAIGSNDMLHTIRLENVPNTTDILVGDLLVTSGLGGLFPAGYPVGTITSIERNVGQPFAEIRVSPQAEIDRSRHLLMVFPQRLKK
jgi:rod shape-determining protein MreC